MKIINPITAGIIKEAKDGDSIRKVAKKTGFAYSAVYRWVMNLEAFGVLDLERQGNKTVISVNRELIYRKFMELSGALETAERDRVFWRLMRKTRFRARFVRGTAAVIWTQGGYITGDFFGKIYHIEVLERDSRGFKEELEKQGIVFAKEGTIPGKGRPFVYIEIGRGLKIERKKGLPVMPLRELVSWCRHLHLEPILEQLDLMYNLGLKVKYSEIYTNV